MLSFHTSSSLSNFHILRNMENTKNSASSTTSEKAVVQNHQLLSSPLNTNPITFLKRLPTAET